MKAKIEVLELEKDEIVTILSGFMGYSSYWCGEVDWNDDNYEEAKKKEADLHIDDEDDVVCLEDVLANMLLDGKSIILKDAEGEFEDVELTLEKLLNGLNLSIRVNSLSLDPEDWDGPDCDMIVQNAVFNEVIYG